MRLPLDCRLLALLSVAAAVACSGNTLPGNDDASVPADQSVTSDMVLPPDMAAPKPDLHKSLPDLTKVTDFANTDFGGVACGNMTCTGANVCCIVPNDGGMSFTSSCQASCADGGVTEACDGPEDCPNGALGGDMAGAKYCCAKIDFTGMGTQCTPAGAVSSCVASCASNLGFSCPMQAKLRLCHQAADCADDPSSYTNCCDLKQNGQGVTACVSDSLVMLAAQFGMALTCY